MSEQRTCAVCGKPIRSCNKIGVCSRTPECIRERARRWKAAHPEKVRESDRRWQAAHHEKVREHKRAYNRRQRAAHPEKVRETDRRWRAAHPEKVRETGRRRYRNAKYIAHLDSLATIERTVKHEIEQCSSDDAPR